MNQGMSTSKIPENEAQFSLKTRDPNGRVFSWQGEIYRAIPAERVEFCERLFSDGVVDELVKKGLLIDTERTTLQMDGYPLILKHRTLPFVSYAEEWCPMMLRDAALKVTDLLITLVGHGLTLQDAHAHNVLFDSTRPLWVDFGSIVPAVTETSLPALDELRLWFLEPLRLRSAGYSGLARWLLQSSEYPALQQEMAVLMRKPSVRSHYNAAKLRLLQMAGRRTPGRLRPLASRALSLGRKLNSRARPASNASPLGSAVQLKRMVESICIPVPRTEWSEYYKEFPSLSPSPEWTLKRHSVHKVLSELKPATVLEIGSNRGWYSQLAASLGSQVVAFDVDETAITQLYIDAKTANQRILPVVMNFKFFTPARGYFCRTRPAANERLSCDLVLAIALTHHLVFKQHLGFDAIVQGLELFAKKWLLVEFKPRENKHVRNWWSEAYSWYTLENFVQALEKRFATVKTVGVEPGASVLLLCER